MQRQRSELVPIGEVFGVLGACATALRAYRSQNSLFPA